MYAEKWAEANIHFKNTEGMPEALCNHEAINCNRLYILCLLVHAFGLLSPKQHGKRGYYHMPSFETIISIVCGASTSLFYYTNVIVWKDKL